MSLPKLPSWWVGKFAKPAEQYHIFRGGDPQRKGDAVTAASLGVLSEVVAGYSLDPGNADRLWEVSTEGLNA